MKIVFKLTLKSDFFKLNLRMVEVQTMKDVFSHGEKSLELRKNEKFLILRPGGQDYYIVRNKRVSKI